MEDALIHEYFRIIFAACEILQVSSCVASLAMIYLHRVNSDISSEIGEIILKHRENLYYTCIFLAARVEENSRSLRDVINAVDTIHSGELKRIEGYLELKKEIIVQEHLVLRCLGFNLLHELPYTYLLSFSSTLKLPAEDVQEAWALLNDSYISSKVLTTPPNLHALGSLFAVVSIEQENIMVDEILRYIDRSEVDHVRDNITPWLVHLSGRKELINS